MPRLRESGRKQRAWARLLPSDAVAADEMVASLGPEAWPPPPLEAFAAAIDQPRHLHPALRHQRDIAGVRRSGSTRSSVRRVSRPSSRGPSWTTKRSSACTPPSTCSATRLTATRRRSAPILPEKPPMPLRIHKREGKPCQRCGTTIAGRLLRRAPDQLLPRGADRRPRPQGPPPLAPAQVASRVDSQAVHSTGLRHKPCQRTYDQRGPRGPFEATADERAADDQRTRADARARARGGRRAVARRSARWRPSATQ